MTEFSQMTCRNPLNSLDHFYAHSDGEPNKNAMKPRETIWNIMELYNLVGGLEHEFHFP